MITAEDLEKYRKKLFSATEKVDGDYDDYSIGYDERFCYVVEDVDLERLVDDLIAYKKDAPEVSDFLLSSKLPKTYREAPYCIELKSKELLCNLDAYPSILAKANANNIFFTLRVEKNTFWDFDNNKVYRIVCGASYPGSCDDAATYVELECATMSYEEYLEGKRR